MGTLRITRELSRHSLYTSAYKLLMKWLVIPPTEIICHMVCFCLHQQLIKLINSCTPDIPLPWNIHNLSVLAWNILHLLLEIHRWFVYAVDFRQKNDGIIQRLWNVMAPWLTNAGGNENLIFIYARCKRNRFTCRGNNAAESFFTSKEVEFSFVGMNFFTLILHTIILHELGLRRPNRES